MAGRDDLVLIGHAYGAAPLALHLSTLSAAGIQVFALDFYSGQNLPHYALALDGFRLAVPKSCVAEAQALLADLPPYQCRRPRWRLVALVFTVGLFGITLVPVTLNAFFRKAYSLHATSG